MSSQSKPIILLNWQEIEATVGRLAAEITKDYCNRNPVLISVLKGSFIFMADLVRLLDFPLEVDFMRLSSYGRSSRTSGKVRVVQDIGSSIKGRDIIVIEDIVDTGLTTSFLLDYLREKNPASLRLSALTEKPSRRKVSVNVDYLGFTVPDKFLVGYGLDWDEKFRYLPDICYVEVE